MNKNSKIYSIQLVVLFVVAVLAYFAAVLNGEMLLSGQQTKTSFKWTVFAIIFFCFIAVAFLLYKVHLVRLKLQDTTNQAKLDNVVLDVKNQQLSELNLAVSNVKQSIIIVGENDLITWVNDHFCETFGYSKAESLGKRISELIAGPETNPDVVSEIDEAVFRNHKAYVTTLVQYRKDKSTLWARAHVSPIMNDKGELKKYVAVIDDITTKKNAEDELKKSEENFKQITKTVNEVFYLYDIVNKKYDYISKNCLEIMGVSNEIFFTGNSHDHLQWHEDDRQKIIDANVRVDNGEPYQIEYRIQVNNEWRWLEERSFPIKNEKGETVRNSGVCSDITDKKRFELELESTVEKTSLLADIGLEISENLSVEHIIKTAYSKILKLMPADSFSVGIVNLDRQELVFPFFFDVGKTYEDIRYSLEKNVLSTLCFKERKEIIINDFENEIQNYIASNRDATGGEAPNSILYLPIITLGEIVGVITVQSMKRNAYSESHLQMLRNISIYLGNAINNIKILDSLEDTVKERTLKVSQQKYEIEKLLKDTKKLADIGFELSSTLKLDSIFEKVLGSLHEMLDATVFSIRIYNKEEDSVHYSYTVEKGARLDPITVPMTEDDNLTVWCIKNRKPIFINDYKKEVLNYVKNQVIPMGEETRSLIFVPMIVQGEVVGVTTVQSFELNAYSEGDLNNMKTLAFYLGIAYSNGLLFETLEDQVEERTKEVQKKTNELLQSIRYAQGIQKATLTKEKEVYTVFEDSLLLYEPKDIVSGDFYNVSTIRTNDQTVLKSIVVADCTGHGVPGAVLAITCNNIIQSTFSNPNINSVGEALDFTRDSLSKLFSQSEETIYDGMDLSWGVWNTNTNELHFAGAFNNCYIVRKGEIFTLKADRMHVGYSDNPKSFNTTSFQLEIDDIILMSTDGYQDQFGGERYKKFSRKKMFELALELDERPLKDQKSFLLDAHLEWKGDYEQTDDLCLFAFRVN